MNRSYIFILTIFFILITGIVIWASTINSLKVKIESKFLHSMNIVLFLLSLLAFFIHQKAINATTNFNFTSKVLTVTIIRMLSVISAIVCYVLFNRQNIGITPLLLVFFLYFLYNFLELFFLLRTVRQNKNKQ